MIVGIIKTGDMIRHPLDVFRIYGLRGCFRLALRALSRKRYQFIDFLDLTSSGLKYRGNR
ncbi:MAG: hypothetical protein HYT77_02630 [Deltaproteobacteria bacterium]|nr:hypothetical protein [Deltaproteobacteria bacterium]